MGGTDIGDQRQSYYRPRIKTRSWAPRVMQFLFSLSSGNAYVIKLSKENIQARQRYRYMDFMNNLIEQLAAPTLEARRLEGVPNFPRSKT